MNMWKLANDLFVLMLLLLFKWNDGPARVRTDVSILQEVLVTDGINMFLFCIASSTKFNISMPFVPMWLVWILPHVGPFTEDQARERPQQAHMPKAVNGCVPVIIQMQCFHIKWEYTFQTFPFLNIFN